MQDSLRFSSLASGSAGNCMVVEKNSTLLMLDCGLSTRETVKRLQFLGLEPQQLSAILITHEHDDHAKGAFKFGAQFQIPIWLSHGTYKMCERYLPNDETLQCNIMSSHHAFVIQDIEVNPFPVPHDAREPTQFTFYDGNHKLGVLTDVGCSTPYIEQMLSGCDALVLECNHDVTMLETGPYARSLKQRVGGRLGHLDNQSAAQLLAKLDNSKLKHLIAAHLSAKNNTPTLARAALSQVLDCEPDWIGIADQTDGFAWRSMV